MQYDFNTTLEIENIKVIYEIVTDDSDRQGYNIQVKY